MKILILAGGSGTRLWPLSRTHYPKQLIKLEENESFLQRTLKRNLKAVPPENLFIVTGRAHFNEVSLQVKELGLGLEKNLILEPMQRSTAPAVALGVLFLLEKRGVAKDEVIFVFPSDHLIAPEEKFLEALKEAEKIAAKGNIVTFGIHPSRPETGFGYLQKGKNGAVARFVEKPNLKDAQNYVMSGEYLWNSGMFAFTGETIMEEFEKHAPEIVRLLREENFENLPSISIDYAIMEKSKRLRFLGLDVSWSDVGSWDHVYEWLPKDENQNAIVGEVVAVDTKNSLILGEKRLISLIGMEDVLVVETEDALLIAKKEQSQKVREIVKKLKEQGRKELEEHRTAFRPWGSYTVLEEGKRYKIKKIQVKPLHKLSLQMHYHRSEHWVVVKGTAKVTIGIEEKIVHEGESFFVPKSSVHRLENPGKVPLEIIEVQVGEYLGEDDIIRFEDVYGRLEEVSKTEAKELSKATIQ